MGTLTKKIHRQVVPVTMAPPITGPKMGPSRVGTPMMPITRPIRFTPAARAMMVWPTGMSIPPPMPWRTRKAIRLVADQAIPQAADPTMKSTNDTM